MRISPGAASLCLAMAAAGALAGPGWSAPSPSSPAAVQAGGSLAAFRSDAELREFLRKRQRQERRRMEAAPMAAPPAAAVADQVVVTGSKASPSITNNQEAGVDEGGIVKQHGDTLVILRRGRLFTVSTAGGRIRPIDMIDAYPPGVSGRGDWYDEMLVSGDRVIVIGYSYARGGTEVNRFRIGPSGRLRFEDAYHLRSNDYYSSRNYASRLIGSRLVYYTPLFLGGGADPLDSLPGIRRWTGDRGDRAFRRITGARQVFIAPRLRDDPEAPIDTLHSVIDCDLAAPVLDCRGTAVLGPASRNFYVSPSAVYLWVSDSWHPGARARGGVRSFVYRLPLGRERPSAIAARGAPTDQFSFREDPGNGLLDVLVRADGGGDWMWNPEVSTGDVALLSIPIRAFGDGSAEVRRDRYRALPSPQGESWNFQNRFVGNHVLYGGGSFGSDRPSVLVAAGLRGGPVAELPLGHAVERIDLLGRDGVVIGSDPRGGLAFTAIDLRSPLARTGHRFTLPDAQQGESRSHGFFYRAADGSGANGLLGLPVARTVEPAYRRFFGSAASLLFLERQQRQFRLAGELDSRVDGVRDDGCRASCVDWYGNARPIFLGNRIFALLGYELVEGRMRGGSIREVDRVNFAPPPVAASR